MGFANVIAIMVIAGVMHSFAFVSIIWMFVVEDSTCSMNATAIKHSFKVIQTAFTMRFHFACSCCNWTFGSLDYSLTKHWFTQKAFKLMLSSYSTSEDFDSFGDLHFVSVDFDSSLT